MVTWGDALLGGDSSAAARHKAEPSESLSKAPLPLPSSSQVEPLLREVNEVFASTGAFAALRADGSVITWGDPSYGGDSSDLPQ